MNSSLSSSAAAAHRDDLRRDARETSSGRAWWRDLLRRKPTGARRAGSRSAVGGVTIRRAFPDDEVALARLATLDATTMPEAPVLVAEVDGELWAAVSIHGRGEAADPFRPSAELLLLLADHARRMQRKERRAARSRRRVARLA